MPILTFTTYINERNLENGHSILNLQRDKYLDGIPNTFYIKKIIKIKDFFDIFVKKPFINAK